MIRRSTWLKWGIALLVVLGLVLGTARTITARKAQQAAAAAQAAQRAEAPLELAATDVVQPRRRTLVQALPISGTLRAATAVVVKAKVAGELQAFSLREGDTVRAGQTIGRIDATDAQARLRQAEQQATSARAQVDMAQRSFDNNNALVQQGFISRTALDTSNSSLEAAQATYRAAQAAVDLASKALQDTVLRAPITGQVAQRFAQNGERLAIDGRVVEIVDLSRIELEASLSPADSLRLRLGQRAELRVEGSSQVLPARVVRINPSTTAGSRAVLAYLELPASEGLRQGLFAQGSLSTGQTEALTLPLEAVRTDKPQPYVQLVRDGKVVHRAVTLGERGQADGQAMVVVPELQADAVVLTGATGVLREGTPVRIAGTAAVAAAASSAVK